MMDPDPYLWLMFRIRIQIQEAQKHSDPDPQHWKYGKCQKINGPKFSASRSGSIIILYGFTHFEIFISLGASPLVCGAGRQ
jgi:hypothetical protein